MNTEELLSIKLNGVTFDGDKEMEEGESVPTSSCQEFQLLAGQHQLSSQGSYLQAC